MKALEVQAAPDRFLRSAAAWRSFRRLRAMDQAGIVALAVLALIAIFAPVLAPHGPAETVGAPLAGPGSQFLLGTDQIGFDLMSRIIFGLRASLIGAGVVVTSGVVIGSLIGLAAGASGGWIDTVLMRLTDVFLALPAPVLAIAVVAAIGPGFFHTLIAIAVVWWPWYARIVRGAITGLRHRPHVQAASLAGVGRLRLWFRHLLPGALPEVLVVASLDIGILVVILAGLSFLGLGAPAPAPELGAMAAQGLRFLLSAWWVPLFPGLAVALLAFVANLAGDGIRDLFERR